MGAILIADIGGTNARFALSIDDKVVAPGEFAAADFASPLLAAQAYLSSAAATSALDGRSLAYGCFAAAGPIIDGAVVFSNSPWQLAQAEAQSALGLKSLFLINDLEAWAGGVGTVAATDKTPVKSGTPVLAAPHLVIGPGTGIGQSLLVPGKDGAPLIFPTEGGHAAFAPETEQEREIAAWLESKHSYVSVERVVSGSAIADLYAAVCAVEGLPKTVTDQSAALIADAAHSNSCAGAVQTFKHYSAILGGAAGNAVLACGALGGLSLVGGVLPKLGPLFDMALFCARFQGRGKMAAYMADVPVDIIAGNHVALAGAARIAALKI